jgi:hypothetical protein
MPIEPTLSHAARQARRTPGALRRAGKPSIASPGRMDGGRAAPYERGATGATG